MSPRPRETTDEHLLAAAHRVINRIGPHLTLADVGREAGVSPATLVQRFGSRRGLLLAFVSSASGATAMQFAQIRESHPDPIDAIRETVRCFALMAPTPDAVSNGLAFLQIDLSDPEFHRHAYVQARDTVEEFRRLLEAAIKAGRLARCDTRHLARALHAIIGGSMLSWAVLREGSAETWMLADVDTLLKPLIVNGDTQLFRKLSKRRRRSKSGNGRPRKG